MRTCRLRYATKYFFIQGGKNDCVKKFCEIFSRHHQWIIYCCRRINVSRHSSERNEMYEKIILYQTFKKFHKINIRDFRASTLHKIRRCYLDSSTSVVSFPQRVIVGRTRSKEEEIPLPRFLSVIAAFLPAQWRVKQSSTLFLIVASLLSYHFEISTRMKALHKLHQILYYCTLRCVRDASAIFVVDESNCCMDRVAD